MERLRSRAEISPKGPYAQELVHGFLLGAIAEGAHRSVPLASDLNVAGIYYGTQLRLRDIGDLMGFKAKVERPRQIVRQCLRQIHKNCPLALQQQYPWEELKNRLGKRKSELVIEKFSAKRGGNR